MTCIYNGKYDPQTIAKEVPGVGEFSKIQRQLIRVGLLDPYEDGKWGMQTQSAWRAFSRLTNDESSQTVQADDLEELSRIKSVSELTFKPKDANSNEHKFAAAAIAQVRKLGGYVAISMGSDRPVWNIVYAEGRYPDGKKSADITDQWDDARMIIQVSSSGEVSSHNWLATTEPGWYYRRNRMNPRGAAQITLDKQFYAWRFGAHGRTYYPALVQTGEIQIHRDRDEDGSRSGEPIESGFYGVNQHHGWNCNTIGKNSAGCLVGRNVSSHQEFIKLLRMDRRVVASSGFTWPTIVLDGSKF